MRRDHARQQYHERAVVARADAIVEPNAVVVHALDAAVALRAVFGARCAHEAARGAHEVVVAGEQQLRIGGRGGQEERRGWRRRRRQRRRRRG